MMVFDSTVVVSTFCCSLVSSLPASLAFLRRAWTASMTSFSCARNASPRSAVHLMFSESRLSASGSSTRAWTLGSQSCFSAAFVSSSPLSVEFLASHCDAATMSSGYVEATRHWASSGSG